MDEAQMIFQQLVVRLTRIYDARVRRGRGCGPEDIVVIWKRREQDAEEETGCWERGSVQDNRTIQCAI